MSNVNRYSDIAVSTEDGKFQLIIDNGFIATAGPAQSLHAHTYYELFYLPAGELRVVYSDRSLTMKANSLLVIPAERLHYTCADDRSQERFSIPFCFADEGSNAFKALFEAMEPISFENNEEMQGAFRRIDRYYSQDRDANRSLIAACFIEILYLLKAEITKSERAAEAQLPGKPMDGEYRDYVIDDYINRSFNGDISLSDLAERVFLSQRQVNRIMQKNYGQSFRQRVIYLRMHNAEQLLTRTDMTVKDIAAEVGYRSSFAFYHIFEKTYGMTPEQFRKSR